MNKKAFTLIELLAVITLLSILSAIVIVNVSSYMDDVGETAYSTLVKSIKSSTEMYVAEHSASFPQLEISGSTFDIELNDLVEDGYIKANLVDERTTTPIPLTTKVHITVISKTKIAVEFGV